MTFTCSETQRRKHLYNLGKTSEYPGPLKKPVEVGRIRRRLLQIRFSSSTPFKDLSQRHRHEALEGTSSTIKRILLTRRYKDHNIYNGTTHSLFSPSQAQRSSICSRFGYSSGRWKANAWWRAGCVRVCRQSGKVQPDPRRSQRRCGLQGEGFGSSVTLNYTG